MPYCPGSTIHLALAVLNHAKSRSGSVSVTRRCAPALRVTLANPFNSRRGRATDVGGGGTDQIVLPPRQRDDRQIGTLGDPTGIATHAQHHGIGVARHSHRLRNLGVTRCQAQTDRKCCNRQGPGGLARKIYFDIIGLPSQHRHIGQNLIAAPFKERGAARPAFPRLDHLHAVHFDPRQPHRARRSAHR